MKPVTQITDRAKRLRANKVHKLRKRCQECAGRRNLGVGHRDGDESNNRPSNLFTQCKSCNGLQAAADKKAGRGVRTRQYNPARLSDAAVDAYISPYRQHAHGSKYKFVSQVNGGALSLHRTLESARRNVRRILAKRSKRNPGATNLAQYVQAAVDHTRGAHDEGGRVLHETPKSKRREFAREIAFRKGYRNPRPFIGPDGKVLYSGKRGTIPYRGFKIKPSGKMFRVFWPDGREFTQRYLTEDAAYAVVDRYAENSRGRNPSEADTLYKKFHGRGPDKIYEMQIKGIDPYGGHPELTSLGPLIRFIVGEGVELGGEFGDEVKEAEWVREISFVPSVARWHEWLERTDPPVAEAKARLRAWKVPDLAAVPNAKQLYILGGSYAVDAAALGSDPEKDWSDLGNVYLIEYFTQKRFDRFEPINYFHHFGEKSGVQPRLLHDRVHNLLFLAGGEYKVTPRGIEN